MIVSRKKILEEEVKNCKLFETLKIGDRCCGVVSKVVNYGLFVDLGGCDGLLYISKIDKNKKHISLVDVSS